MTTIVGLVDDGSVYLASDSRRTVGSVVLPSSADKIARYDHLLVAASGTERLTNLLQCFEPPKLEGDPFRYLVTRLVPALRAWLREQGYFEPGKEHALESGALVIAFAGALWYVDSYFAVTRVAGGIFGTGSGCEYAEGALAALAQCADLSPTQRLYQALDIAARFDPASGPPFHIARLVAGD